MSELSHAAPSERIDAVDLDAVRSDALGSDGVGDGVGSAGLGDGVGSAGVGDGVGSAGVAKEAPSCGSAAVRAASGSTAETLEQYARDYPRGPHDQPQSMCPAFGSLRVGLRMRRTATLLSGSACCVYGLTFTSHFYGAKRTVGYVPFNSETLVTGRLFEDIRDAVHELAQPQDLDAIVVINLCVPTASGVPLDLLPNTIDGVRVIGIDVPGFGVPTHAEAKDVLAGAMLKVARAEAEAGPVASPAQSADGAREGRVALLGELFPADPMVVDQLLAPLGLSAGPVVPTREWRELYAALDCPVVAAVHPFYTAAVREFQAAGRKVLGSAPVGAEGTAAWIRQIGDAFGLPAARVSGVADGAFAATRAALQQAPVKGRITLSGYEGSELLVARVLVESGANLRYVGSACPATPWSKEDAEWLEAHGVTVRFRASLEEDLAAMAEYQPDLVIGTTPVVQKAKEAAIPSLYFTNLISARPLLGPAGAGSLATVINAAIANRERFDGMREFFEGVGTERNTGIWRDSPQDFPKYRARYVNRRAKESKPVEVMG